MCIQYLIAKFNKKQDSGSNNLNDDSASANGSSNTGVEAAAREDVGKGTTTSSLINFKTQRGRNFFVVMILGLSAALDYVMSLMSIQAYYYILGGNPSLYGLAMGIYDIGQLVFSPIFGYIADKTHRYVGLFFAGVLLQIAGNLLYALLFQISLKGNANPNLGWQLMIVARLIAGCGSAVLNLGSAYLTTHTSFQERFGALGSYRVWQSVARMVGPMIGFLFVAVPTPTQQSGEIGVLFNFYTIPGWVAAIVSFITLIMLITMFRHVEPADEEGVFQHKFDFKTCDKKPGSFIFGVFINSVVQLLFGFSIWALMSQLFGFGFAQFKVIQSQYDSWKPFVGVGCGSVAALIFWKRVTPLLKLEHPELRYSFIGTIALTIAALLLVPYYPLGEQDPPALFYAGTVFVGISTSWFFSNQEISFSKQLSHSRNIVGGDVNRFMGFYGAVGALSRFLGPFLAGYAFAITDVDGNPPTSGVETCNANQTCCLGTVEYVSKSCEFRGAEIIVPILVVFGFLSVILQNWYNYVLLQYPKELGEVEQAEEDQQQAVTQI